MPRRQMASGGIAPPFLTSALGEGEWSASRLCRFTPGGRASGTRWIGGWMSPRVGPDVVENRTRAVQPVPILTELSLLLEIGEAIPVTGHGGPLRL
jgi:hypothetical protein